MHTLWNALFGGGTWGTGGNLVAAALLTALGYIFRKPLGTVAGKVQAHAIARPLELLNSRVKTHVTTEVASHMAALHKTLAAHHQAQLDRIDAHAEAIKAHVTTVGAATVSQVNTTTPAPQKPQTIAEAIGKTPRGRGTS